MQGKFNVYNKVSHDDKPRGIKIAKRKNAPREMH